MIRYDEEGEAVADQCSDSVRLLTPLEQRLIRQARQARDREIADELAAHLDIYNEGWLRPLIDRLAARFSGEGKG